MIWLPLLQNSSAYNDFNAQLSKQPSTDAIDSLQTRNVSFKTSKHLTDGRGPLVGSRLP